MSIPDALAVFAEPRTTTVTILEITIYAILDSDVWGLRHPSRLSIHQSRKRLSLNKKANVRADKSLSLSKKSLVNLPDSLSMVLFQFEILVKLYEAHEFTWITYFFPWVLLNKANSHKEGDTYGRGGWFHMAYIYLIKILVIYNTEQTGHVVKFSEEKC
jgi:hypothetical protein